ncbi:glycerophosphodiester phosphodiesterase family protein [Roseibium algae]|uniref:Glycerophosphodiester phosphodiesterase family protein n=1 Tax=Roseibium algae TaxID=3123038 RepID=A0ABU8TMP6_9HYPH
MRNTLFAFIAIALGLHFVNASRFAPAPDANIHLIAHRGIHQTYSSKDLKRDDCTATRINSPTHEYLENTIPSMEAAFAAGADVIELDVAPTTDGQFAVFHDWTLDCRTEGSGPVRAQSMDALRKLDIGYGYTADGGKTFPFRGKGIGLMPSLTEVLNRFPEGQFLVNFKSKDSTEADALAKLLAENPRWRDSIWSVYGGEIPTNRAHELMPDIMGFTKDGIKSCLKEYIALGWSGHVPDACKNTRLMIPSDYTWLIWGWPNRFQQRMQNNGTTVILTGPLKGYGGIEALQHPAEVIPDHFIGYVWTNKIEEIGPILASSPRPDSTVTFNPDLGLPNQEPQPEFQAPPRVYCCAPPPIQVPISTRPDIKALSDKPQ